MILVIGDIIVDEFVMGDVSRISPEAPVPVVFVEHIERRLGGSSNVVRNLHAVDSSSAMFGMIGDDEPGRWVMQQLREMDSETDGVCIQNDGRPTAIKTRIIARHQQVVRYDRESVQPVSNESWEAIRGKILAGLADADAVILSDYGKGMFTSEILGELMPLLAGHIVTVDPKPMHTAAYRGATAITPNLHEAAAMSGVAAVNEDTHVEKMARRLCEQLQLKYVLITRSEKGMTLFDGSTCHHIPTAARDVFDVTGAGDTVIAVFTACLARGDDALTAAKYANLAAGVVVGKVGTATATWDEIRAYA